MNIKLKYLIAMNTLVSKDVSRHRAVKFESTAKRALLIATDGKRMGVLRLPPLEAPNCIIPSALIELMWKSSGDHDAEVGITVKGKRVSAYCDGCEISMPVTDEPFPLWRMALPGQFVAPLDVAVSPDFLQSFNDVARMLGSIGGMIMRSSGEFEPIEITFPSLPDFYGVLMPMIIPDKDTDRDFGWVREISV